MEINNLSKEGIFPIDIFPSEIIEVLIECNNTLNYPLEYLGSSILSAAALAIGNTYHIEFKKGFVQKATIFMVLVGKPGDIKSHPLNFAFKPVRDKDDIAHKEYIKAYSEYENSKKNNDSIADPKPIFKKFELNDFTPESLIKIHSHNKRGVGINVDELAGWIKNFQRYNKSSEAEMYLSIWTGNPISIDRKGDEPIRINDPFVNVIGTMQTKIIDELAKDNRSNNGFIERLLFAIVENPPPLLWNDKEIKQEDVSKYVCMIDRLFSLEYVDYEPNIMHFSKDAKQHLINWQNNKRNDLQNNGLDNELSIQAKLEIYAIRFSLIIQLMFWAVGRKNKGKVELFAVEKAIKLIEYYRLNALKIHQRIFDKNPIDDLHNTHKFFYESLSDKFSTAEALVKGKEIEIPERTVKNLLKKKELFKKINHGVYTKAQY